MDDVDNIDFNLDDINSYIEEAKKSFTTSPQKDENGEEESELDFNSKLGRDLQKLGLTKEELDKKCMEIFGQTYEFKQRGDSKLDMAIHSIIKELKVKVPIVHIKDRQYLIGLNKCSCEIRGNNVMIRVGGGYETFK